MTGMNLMWGLLAVGAACLRLWSFVVLTRRHAPIQPISESLLAASVLFVLSINAEIYLLSAIPVERPLGYLPLFHLAVTVVLATASWRGAGISAWRQTLWAVVGSFALLWRDCGWVVRLGSLVTVGMLGVYLLVGAYRVPSAWDELEYHVPMAVQPYQDGRVGPVTSDLPWANAYPRGVALLWYWTLQWSGTDLLFHPVQFAFGLQFLLAVYVLACRSGVRPGVALLVTIVMASMPVFFILTTCGYIDVAVAATVITVVAFLAPPRTQEDGVRHDWLLAGLALGQACLVKPPLMAVALGGIAFLHDVFFRMGPRVGLRSIPRFVFSARGLAMLLVVLLCCHTHLRLWAERGNPLYPLRVTLAGRVMFDGPLDAARFGIGGHTTMGQVSEMSHLQRFWASWVDLYQPLNVDSFGGFGPVVPVAIVFLFVSFAVRALLARTTWHLALVLMISLCFATPSYLPRYGLPMVAIATVGAAWVVSRFPRELSVAATVGVVLLCALGSAKSITYLWEELKWLTSQAGGQIPLATRNAFLLEKHQIGLADIYCTPEMIRYIRDHSGPGDVLVWNVRTFPGLLWNRTYSNRVIHLAGSRHDVYPGSAATLMEPTEEEMNRWLGEVLRLRPKHVLVYAQSAYARALTDRDELGYNQVFYDSDSRGPGAMVLFEHAGGRSPPPG